MNLTVSIVIHHWHSQTLLCCLRSLEESATFAREKGVLNSLGVRVHHNGKSVGTGALQSIQEYLESITVFNEIQTCKPNCGYGCSNNYALSDGFWPTQDDAILILNPDVALEPETLYRGLYRLKENRYAGLVCGNLFSCDGLTHQWGCRRYPSLAVLLARKFSRLTFWSALDCLNKAYECRDHAEHYTTAVELSSGCFMLMRRSVWHQVGGFDERFFMYFEDYDLSMKVGMMGWMKVYDPAIRVRHEGGGCGAKGWRHQWWFLCSAVRFFSRYGWRFWSVGLSSKQSAKGRR